MKVNKGAMLVLFFATAISGCSQLSGKSSNGEKGFRNESENVSTETQEAEYLENLDRNQHKKVYADVIFSIHELTPDFRASQLYDVGTEAYASELEEQKKLTVYKLRTQNRNGTSVLDRFTGKFQNREAILSYFNSSLSQSVRLFTQHDTLVPVVCHMEQTAGLTDYVDVIMAFEHTQTSHEPVTMVFEDNFYNKGRIKLKTNRI